MAKKKEKKDQMQKKEQKKEEVDKEDSKKSSFSTCKIIGSVIAILLAVAFYQFYVTFLTTPELPKFDLDASWGPKNKDTSIRPYRILLTDSMQENLRRKFEAYRRATRIKSLNESSSYGMNADVLGQIFSHWQFKYKYSIQTRYLNKFNHYKVNIQGLDIHFMRVVPENVKNVKYFDSNGWAPLVCEKYHNVEISKALCEFSDFALSWLTNISRNYLEKVLPLLLLHGFPSSVRDFYDIIPLLTEVRPGYDFVFEVIAPSLPGFTYSQATTKPGLTTYQMAIIIRNLMEKIGHKKFYVHGGDLGHIVGSHLATIFPDQVLGFHTSTPLNLSKLAHLTYILGSICPKCFAGDLADKMYPLKDKIHYILEESGYLHFQTTKPDTLGIALQDSPLGLAAYIIEKYLLYSNPENKETYNGGLDTFNTTDLIDNVLMYWSTGSITTSLRVYKENDLNFNTEEALARIPTPVPTWALRTEHDLIHQPDCVLRWKYPNLVGTTDLDGGHYIAFEKPVEVADDLFKAVKTFLNR